MKNKILIGAISTVVALGMFEVMTTTKDVSKAQGYQHRYGQTTTPTTVTQDSTSNVIDTQESSINYGAQAAKNDSDLTLEDMLTYSMQDEYLARKEYRIIMDEYGEQRPFSNIILSEEKHISMLTNLFNKYQLTVPADQAANYVTLPSSLNEAYQAGVDAEIENIAMYDRFLKEDIPTDVENVFIALRDASKNHLSAFQNHVR